MRKLYFICLFAVSTTVLAADLREGPPFEVIYKNDMVVVTEAIKTSVPALFFLDSLTRRFDNDGGSLTLSFTPEGFKTYVDITAPRDRQDLAEFTMKYLRDNCTELSIKIDNDDQFESVVNFTKKIQSNGDFFILCNKKIKTICIVGMKTTCQEIFSQLTDFLNTNNNQQ